MKCVSEYFGITQDSNSQDFMIIMPYYEESDLIHHITKDFYNLTWDTKLYNLKETNNGLINLHGVNIIHRDFHSGNIFFESDENVRIGDLGISKSTTESTNDDSDEIYGIIPYMAPEIFQRQKYTKASDVYSFGMVMWEFMTGRRPFWDRDHDTDLIIEILDGLRPPIVTNAPEGYIELMKECWHSDPEKRPIPFDISYKIHQIAAAESKKYSNPTPIIPSPDIGPVKTNNPGAIYKSRPLSDMIQSAISSRSSRSRSINLESDESDPFYYYPKNNMSINAGKRKFENNLDNDNGQNIKRKKSSKNENNDYLTIEIELDID
ncbi:kinase-like domain-containing protein [Glomus cerebriforme]|uniref:Kinase-like domain-containing protein n=1 Tax=Glomus cerebriforme TaxID=658196 RepID=A0A397SG43_9GLOM|nr:kinase-like domain-containing protein [Glomus cerebriforme]